jgi:hypothetical protein
MLLREAIDNLYTVFGRYDRPDRFDACICCMDDPEKAIMLSTPLADLTADNLRSYTSSLFHTVGGVADFRHFLPRILEICTTSDFIDPDIEIILKKLSFADWLNWPQPDQTAVTAVIDAKFDELISDPNFDIYTFDSWVCAIGSCVDTITPYLDRFLEAGREEDLMAYINKNLSAFTKHKLSNVFWEKGSLNEQLALEWFQNDRITVLVYVTYGMVI